MTQGHYLIAQNKVQVVTRTIQKSFDYSIGDVINIQGEKADIKVMGWSQNEVEVTIKLISKALSIEVATRELDQAKYVSEKRKQELNLKNYFVRHKDKESFEAVLSASFEVKIPYEMMLNIVSRYGLVNLSYLKGKVNVETKYCKLNLSELNVSGGFNAYFGDLNLNNITGRSTFDLQHVRTILNGTIEDITINSNLGDILIDKPTIIKSLKIAGTKSDITIRGINKKDYLYDLMTEFGNIYLSENTETDSQLKSWKFGNYDQPQIYVKTKFGDIKLKQE